ncbi:hypothetical protein J4226_00615 [Candidatus Pacearchaeota archaeon]|nr:hypothetical protein [Candidatus Pacearchaeota archaeon]
MADIKGVGISVGEFFYGVGSLIFGYPTMEKVLAGEILLQVTGSLRMVMAILFGLIFLLGYIALIDFICRNCCDTTFADEMNKVLEKYF